MSGTWPAVGMLPPVSCVFLEEVEKPGVHTVGLGLSVPTTERGRFHFQERALPPVFTTCGERKIIVKNKSLLKLSVSKWFASLMSKQISFAGSAGTK